MPSFDVVSRVNAQEVANAVNNALKEIVNRYDFRNTGTEVEWNSDASTIVITSSADGRVTAAYDVLQSKMVKRSVSLKSLKPGPIKQGAGGRSRMEIAVQQGIPQDLAKTIVKDVKSSKIKVQGAIQGDELRFSGKKRDDLQAAIAQIKEADYEIPLQFVNFRD